MQTVKFTLDNLYYPEISVRANPEFDRDCEDEISQPRLTMKLFEHDENTYQIVMHYAISASNPSDAYSIEAFVAGAFSVDSSIPPEAQIEMVSFSGPNILYGALRDHLSSITARAPWKEFILPPVMLGPEDFSTDPQEDVPSLE